MSYKNYKIERVRKVSWDQLWHVMYYVRDYYSRKRYLTWDRVSRDEALRIADNLKPTGCQTVPA